MVVCLPLSAGAAWTLVPRTSITMATSITSAALVRMVAVIEHSVSKLESLSQTWVLSAVSNGESSCVMLQSLILIVVPNVSFRNPADTLIFTKT